MPDQSFNLFTISSALKKGDFYSHKQLATDAGKALEISGAVFLANSSFIDSNPLETISVRGRKVHRPKDFARTLIVRKLYQNLTAVLPVSQPGRKHILRNIRSILIEGLPYRVYKADVRKFYESFDHAAIMNRIDTLPVSDHTKLLTMSILNQHWKAGYRGLPVGLSLSSPLSEIMMSNFDAYVRGHEAVHYYARYVDDLLIISSGQERQRFFETHLSLQLPMGLQFGRNKSYCRETLLPLTSPFELSFLGYRFRISTGKKLAKGREVTADVSNNKVKKLKTRIMRSLISFSKSHDFLLLEKRIQFLTSNLSLPKAGSSVRQLIGLGHMYPDLTGESASLAELDVFLRSSILSSNGRSFATYALSRKQKNKLLAYSFVRGHTKNKFFYFSHKPSRISRGAGHLKTKRNRKRIRRTDYNRVLVTETQPNEVPLVFSNDGFYRSLSKRGTNSSLRNLLLDEFLCKKGQLWSKPYRYKIRKSATEFRRLGLIHPTNQWLWTKFYQEYDDRILHLCSLSSMSVRAPKRVAATFYTPSDLNINNVIKGMTATTEEEESHLEYSTSYFSYRGYIRLYQFYSSAEFLNLEKRFPHLTTLDVARCFDSIYTHTMAWAVTSKTFSKQNLRSKSFSDDFDTHMQFCNEGETNGIIIGPEVSRVFAEIILQRVDKVAEATLQAEKKTEGVDYVLRRYVDDVVIFATDEETADLVYERYSDALRTVNMSVNASKKKHDMRPFVTAKSKSIVEVTRETILFLGELFDLDSPTLAPRQTWRQEKIALGFIRRIKLLCLDIGSSYDDVASYVIATITRQLIDVVQASRDPFDVDTGARAYKSFSALLEVLFFLYSVAPSVTASYTLGRALVVLIRFVRARLTDWDTSLSERVIASIREFLGSACRSIHKIVGSHVPLEAINILLIAAELGEQYPVGAHLLEEIFVPPGQTVQSHKWTYFEYISCMYAMGSSALYTDLRQQVIIELDKTLANLDDLRQNSELAHLVLDMSVCPHVDLPRRGMWLRRIAKVLGVTVSAAQIAEYGANNSYWFVNWSSLDILNVLQKKELSPAY